MTDKKAITRNLRCVLTDKEIIQASRDSADLTRAIEALEDDKSRSSKEFAARIAQNESARSVLNDKVTSGYELRDVSCMVFMGVPRPGFKRIVRQDTGDEVAVEAMTPDELQRELDLESGFKFNPDGRCVNPFKMTLRPPGAAIALLLARGPDGEWFSGLEAPGFTPGEGWACELQGNKYETLAAALEQARVVAQTFLFDEVSKEAAQWMSIVVESIEAAAKLVAPAKEVAVE